MKKLNEILRDESREKYLMVFITAFLLSAAALLPFVIEQGGYFVYYGDFNLQYIPFNCHAHSAVRQGNFGWDFVTDLGSYIVGTHYMLGSPFFWLTVLFPDSAVPYLIPWFICLKIAAAALTAYMFIREFTPNRNACFFGGLLYAFSGFQLRNMMFAQFFDPVALFPILLLASDKFMMKNKRGLFALIVALCAATDYFFFAQMAVFTVIWFIVNVITGRYKFKFGKFCNYAFEAVLGVAMAAVILLPSIKILLGNARVGRLISPENAFIYNEKITYFYILKSFFTFPELPMKLALEVPEHVVTAACFLPFVSASGVIAYVLLQKRRKALGGDMLAIIFAVSVISMFVPFLGSLFTLLNAQYYTRWFFAPVLIMCVMTAVSAGEDISLFKKTSIPCMAAAAIITAGSVLYIIISGKGDITIALITGVVPAGCLALLLSCLSENAAKSNGVKLLAVLKRTAVCCAALTSLAAAQGRMGIEKRDIKEYVDNAFNSRESVEALKRQNSEFFRVDICEEYTNLNLMWEIGSCSSFISAINTSVDDVQDALGFPRNVASLPPHDYSAFRMLTSVKYYFDTPIYNDDGRAEPFPILGNTVEEFEYAGEAGNMLLYENNCFIPMGFTYDYYISPEDIYNVQARIYRSGVLLEAVALTDGQQERFSDILRPYDITKETQKGYDHARLSEIAEEKRQTACRDFYTDSKGFGAVFENNGEGDKLVFFSVPYDDGWSAQINGEPAAVEKVSYGFMALRCKEGVSEIRFDYKSKPLAAGGIVSLGGIAVLVIYVLICKMRKNEALR